MPDYFNSAYSFVLWKFNWRTLEKECASDPIQITDQLILYAELAYTFQGIKEKKQPGLIKKWEVKQVTDENSCDFIKQWQSC